MTMSNRYQYDWIDGRQVPPLVIDQDHVLTGTHNGTVHVEAGHFTLAGKNRGTLNIYRDITATITGTQRGTVSVGAGSMVTVSGAIEGTTNVESGATIVIEAHAKLAGTLHNDGIVVVRGVFGGAQSGSGELRLEGSGYIKAPKTRNGVHYYE